MNLIDNPKVSGGIFTAIVLGLLIFAGPAQAITISLTGFGISSVAQGGKITTNASLDVNSQLNSDEVDLNINGPASRTCIFKLNGTVISGSISDCSGININLDSGNISGIGSGFGYGYGLTTNSVLNYSITIDTTGFSSGSYSIWLSSNGFNSSIENLSITTPSSSSNNNDGNNNGGGGRNLRNIPVILSPIVPIITAPATPETAQTEGISAGITGASGSGNSSPETEATTTTGGLFGTLTGGVVSALRTGKGKVWVVIITLVVMIFAVGLSLYRRIVADTIPRKNYPSFTNY